MQTQDPNDPRMSTTRLDTVDILLDAVDSGKSLIKNRNILHYTYIPNIIYHRDSEQKQVTQSCRERVAGNVKAALGHLVADRIEEEIEPRSDSQLAGRGDRRQHDRAEPQATTGQQESMDDPG